MVRTKVFVGNLSFKTREAELSTQFSQVAKVISANIITRGPRSLGYGFVELESEEEAQKAVAAMDKKEIDGRQINVEVANPRQEAEANAAQGEGAAPAARGARRTRGTNANATANNNNNNNAAAAATGAAPATGATRGARGAARGTRGAARGGRGGRRGGKAEGQPQGQGQPQEQQQGEGAAPARRARRAPKAEGEKKEETRVESPTSLFVANLPFSLNDESFGTVFNEASLKFKSAHVVTKRNGRSKGFGFVEFDNHEDQQKALNTLNGKKVEERELILRVALTDESGKNKEQQQGENAPAAVAVKTEENN